MAIKDISDALFTESPNKTLYHYTSLTGLLGIIKSRAFWASEIRYFNDSAEMKYTADLLRNEISRRLDQGEGNSKLLSQFREWISHRITDGHMIFVMSLTANGNLLSQWRGYCPLDNGKEPFQSFSLIVSFRNELVHYKGEFHPKNTPPIKKIKALMDFWGVESKASFIEEDCSSWVYDLLNSRDLGHWVASKTSEFEAQLMAILNGSTNAVERFG